MHINSCIQQTILGLKSARGNWVRTLDFCPLQQVLGSGSESDGTTYWYLASVKWGSYLSPACEACERWGLMR